MEGAYGLNVTRLASSVSTAVHWAVEGHDNEPWTPSVACFRWRGDRGLNAISLPRSIASSATYVVVDGHDTASRLKIGLAEFGAIVTALGWPGERGLNVTSWPGSEPGPEAGIGICHR